MSSTQCVRYLLLGLSAVIAGVTGKAAFAQASDETTADPGHAIVIRIGASLEMGPSFPGSARSNLSVVPDFDWRRMGESEENAAPDDNFDIGLIDIGNFSAGPVVGLRDSRNPKDEEALRGLRRIKLGLDAGVFAQYWLVPDVWRLRAEVRHAVSNRTGLVADIGSDYFVRAEEQWLFSAGPRASFGNGRHADRYFGVSAAEAAANRHVTPFDPQGGLQSVGLAVSATYQLTDDWSLRAYGRYDRLVGDAARSPIVRNLGNPDQFTAGIGFTKSFTVNF